MCSIGTRRPAKQKHPMLIECRLNRYFAPAAFFQFCGGLVENGLRCLCLYGQQRAGAKDNLEDVLDAHGVDVF